MNYAETLDYLFKQLPMYQRDGKAAYKANLDNTIRLDEYLNHPHKSFKSIHVGGTNGKGSSSHMLASILQEAGYKVGLYTSPHLKDFKERIKINGKLISEKYVIDFVENHKAVFADWGLSFFEWTVGLAFDYFRAEEVDVAIIEVGMGGRLDSTNIIQPICSLITNIGLDHQQFLGDTKELIAAEKAGIIKKNTPVIISEKQAETTPIFESKAKEQSAQITYAELTKVELYPTDLKGLYQKKNQKGVLASIPYIKHAGYKITEEDIKNGLLNVVLNTGLMGRWQILDNNPKMICDTAHNKEGLSYILTQLQNEQYSRLHLVLGFVNDKNVSAIFQLFPKDAQYYLCQANIARALPVEELSKVSENAGVTFTSFKTVGLALEAAKKSATSTDLIYVGGSTFVVAEVV